MAETTTPKTDYDLDMRENTEAVTNTGGKDKLEKHEIFNRDPATLYNYMHKEVEITSTTKEVFKGRVCTVDPVSYSFILLDCNINSSSDTNKPKEILTLVVGHNIVDVKITDHLVTNEIKNTIDGLHSVSSSSKDSATENQQILERKAKLLHWFKENHISIETSEQDETVLTLNDLIEIRPPYTKDDCFCTNHIVLGRILDLMDKMPD